jgi:hypothetical protein
MFDSEFEAAYRAAAERIGERIAERRNSRIPRRLPAPWSVEKISGGYVLRDANGQALAYVYSRATESEAIQAKVLTDDEARCVAVNIARLPNLLGAVSNGG